MLLLIILKIMAKKLKFDRDKNGIKYKFPERSCLECSKYPYFTGIDKCVCDFAKYGCTQYVYSI